MWTDVGHINLIGGLVTRNQPNKKLILFTENLDLIKDTLVVMEQYANVKDEKESVMEKFGLLKCVIIDTVTLQHRQMHNVFLNLLLL